MTWDEAFSRLTAVRDELEAARFSLRRAQEALQAGEDFLGHQSAVRPSHVRECARHLEMTYLLRLFAEFEHVLRDYWHTARPRAVRRRTRMEILINRIAAICAIPFDALENAHDVREYRNAIVHSDEASRLTFNECKSRLGTFLSFLPRRW